MTLSTRPVRAALSALALTAVLTAPAAAQDQAALITPITEPLTFVFIPKVIHEMASQHLSGKANHGLRLWTLILFHIWRREVLRL